MYPLRLKRREKRTIPERVSTKQPMPPGGKIGILLQNARFANQDRKTAENAKLKTGNGEIIPRI